MSLCLARPRRRWIALALLAASGCAKPAAETAVLRLPLTAAPDSLDPRRALIAVNGLMQRQALETLVEYDAAHSELAAVQPLLAESWTSSADGLSWTFQLRATARFHDPEDPPLWPKHERAVEAADVVASWVRHAAARNDQENTWWAFEGLFLGLDELRAAVLAAPGAAEADALWRAAARAGVAGLRAQDARTIELRLARADGFFLQRLASQAFAVLPRELAEAEVRDPRQHMVGSGPFALTAWEPGQRAEFHRVPGWRGQIAPDGGTAPFVDELRFDLIRDSAARNLMFENGTLHRISLAPDGIARFTDGGVLKPQWQAAGAHLQRLVAADLALLIFNQRDAVIGALPQDPAADARRVQLRAALACAFPREAWHRLVRGGITAVPARGFLPPLLPEAAACADFPHLGADLTRAAALLAAAGHAGGADLPELVFDLTGDDPLTRSVGDAYVENLRQLGVRCRAQPNVWGSLLERAQRGEFQITLQSWTLDWPDAAMLFALFWSGNAGTDANLSQFRDPRFDADWEALQRCADPILRAELCVRLAGILAERVPAMPIDHRLGYLLIQPGVAGATGHTFDPIACKFVRLAASR